MLCDHETKVIYLMCRIEFYFLGGGGGGGLNYEGSISTGTSQLLCDPETKLIYLMCPVVVRRLNFMAMPQQWSQYLPPIPGGGGQSLVVESRLMEQWGCQIDPIWRT